ncbi:MAG: phosphoglycerate dehydrogenase [Candidatus Marinamargulisbacteria bacterium]
MENAVLEKVHNSENDKDYTFRIRTYNKVSSKGLDLFPLDSFEIASELTDADAFILRSHKLHGESFPNSVKAIGRAGAGVNNIPVDSCTESGIVVFNTPGANANAVKELVIAGMLLSARDIVGGIEYVKSIHNEGDAIPELVEKNKARFKGSELTGKRLGVIGLGAIGLQVANAGLSMGMDVQGYDPFISVNAAWELSSDVHRAGSLERLIRECDYISVHVPFSDKTKGFLNEDRIQMLKKGAVLLNFSRNELVDEDAMKLALNEEKVAKYVTDFPNPKLVDAKNVISIPHLGASTAEAEDNCAIMVSNQVKDFLLNGSIVNSVNFPTSQMERSTPYRVTIVNRNVPNIIGQITSVIADAGVNIAEMVNKSREGIAYNMIDLDQDLDQSTIDQLLGVDGVVRVRQLPIHSS